MSNPKLALLFLLLVAILLPGRGCSLWSQRIENGQVWLDADNGLPSSTVYKVIQDKNGFIWMATENGAVQYDGINFRIFNERNGLPENEVMNLFEDSQGRIWMLTFTRGAVFYQDGIIHNAGNDPIVKQFFKGPQTIFFGYESRNGAIFLAVQSRGFYIIKGNQVSFTEVAKSSIRAFWEDEEGNVWTLKSRDSVLQADGVSPGLVKPMNNNIVVSNQPGDFIQNEDGSILTSDLNLGIVRLQGNKLTVFHPFRLRNYFLNALRMLSGGDLIFCYQNIGVERLRYLGNGKYASQTEPVFTEGTFTSVLEDREGNLWFSTQNRGVVLVKQQSIRTWYPGKNMPLRNISVVSAKAGGRLLLAGEESLFGMYSGSRIDSTGFFINLPLGQLYDLEMSPTGKLLMASSALVVIDQINPEVLSEIARPSVTQWYSEKTKPKPPYIAKGFKAVADIGSVKAVSEDPWNRRLWFASSSYLGYYDWKNGQIGDQPTVVLKQRGTTVWAESATTVYFSTPGGAWKLDVPSGDTLFLGKRHPELRDNIYVIMRHPSGGILFAGNNGVNILKGNELIHLGEEEGLPSDKCKTLWVDEQGIIWAGTSNGLARIELRPGNDPVIRRISTADGLASNEVNSISGTGDTIFVATNKGISIFTDKQLVPTRRIPPPTYITRIFVQGRDTLVGSHFSLPHTSNSVRFQFAGLSYASIGQMRYRYRLLGFDSVWVSTTLPEAWFNYLKPGEYQLEVIALNKEGVASEKPAVLSFTILTPWYQQWTFRVGLVLLAVGIIWAGIFIRYRARIRRERTRRQLLEAEHRALRAQMNPHFLFNSMASIQGFIATNDQKEAITYFSRLGKLIRLMLDASRNQSVTLRDEIQSLTLYAQLEQLRTGHKFTFEIIVDPEIPSESIRIPPMLIQPYLENAIWHGVQHKPQGGHILIRISERNKLLHCLIEDNGIGRKRSDELKEKQSSRHKSQGTRITEERLALLHEGRPGIRPVIITDLVDERGEATGTRVEILMPFQEENYTNFEKVN